MEEKNGTGVTDVEYLAKHRLKFPGCFDYLAILMTIDQIRERRMFLRKILAAFPRWEGLSNEQLDNIRVYRVGNGYIGEDEKGYQYYLKDDGVPETEAEFRRTRAMIPFEFLTTTARDFGWSCYCEDVSVSRRMISDYIVKYLYFSKSGMGLYIYSETKGSGKTMLACCLINEISKRYNGSVKFANILDFLEMTKKGFNGVDEEVNALYNAGCLVLDDIGVQMSKEWVDTVLYRLVNFRYVNRLPTIYTSNIPLNKLKIDDRITDRIDATTYPVKLPEESIRRDMRRQEKQKLLEEIKNAPR